MTHLLDVTDSYEVRKLKLHIIDKINNPERHDFSKDYYDLHEWRLKCNLCRVNFINQFEIDYYTNRMMKQRDLIK